MAAMTVVSVSAAGALRASFGAVGNFAPHVRSLPVARAVCTVRKNYLSVSLYGRQTGARCRFSSQNNQVSTAAINSVPVQVARELLNAGHKYLDVRTTEEFSAGHVEGAVNVPYMKSAGQGMTKNLRFIEDVTEKFIQDDELVVGCLSGKRSMMAAAELQAAEFSKITDMAGGYKAWVDSGLPTTKA